MKYYRQKDLVVSIKGPDNKDEFIDYLTEADQNAEKLIKKELGLLIKYRIEIDPITIKELCKLADEVSLNFIELIENYRLGEKW